MPKYTLKTLGGLTPGFGKAVVGGQAALLYVTIQKQSEPTRAAGYVVYGLGGSVGPKGGVSIAQGPQTSSDFDSPVEQADLFGGSVRILESQVQLGLFNFGYSDMRWISGTATGTTCSGVGGGLCLGLQLSVGSSTTVVFKFLDWTAVETTESKAAYTPPPSRQTDRSGRVLEQ